MNLQILKLWAVAAWANSSPYTKTESLEIAVSENVVESWSI